MTDEIKIRPSIAKKCETGYTIIEAMGCTTESPPTAAEIAPWLETLHPSALQGGMECVEAVGRAWDEVSPIVLNGASVAASSIHELLRDIEVGARKTAAAGHEVGQLPLSIRTCTDTSGERDFMVIDVELPGLTLPVLFDRHAAVKLENDDGLTAAAKQVLALIAAAGKAGGRIRKRDARMREALETSLAAIGEGVAPLWLRPVPIPVWESPKLVADLHYAVILLMLDETLAWSPVAERRVWTLRELRRFVSQRGAEHRPRAARLAQLHAAGASAMISDVAASFIRQRGLDAAEVARQTLETRRADRHAGVEYADDFSTTILRYEDGVVNATVMFKGGVYSPGSLRLFGQHPGAIAASCKGKTLGQIVELEAFKAGGPVISKVRVEQDGLDLHHVPKLSFVNWIE